MCITIVMLCCVRTPLQMRNVRFLMELILIQALWSIFDLNHFIHNQMMSSFCVIFFFFGHSQQTQSICAMSKNVLPYISEMILKMFTNIKTFDLKINTTIFLITSEYLFSQHFEIQYCRNCSPNNFTL